MPKVNDIGHRSSVTLCFRMYERKMKRAYMRSFKLLIITSRSETKAKVSTIARLSCAARLGRLEAALRSLTVRVSQSLPCWTHPQACIEQQRLQRSTLVALQNYLHRKHAYALALRSNRTARLERALDRVKSNCIQQRSRRFFLRKLFVHW